MRLTLIQWLVKANEERLERGESGKACQLVPPRWGPACDKLPYRIRCDNEQIARGVLRHIQFGLVFFSERDVKIPENDVERM